MTDDCTDESGRPLCKLDLGKLAAERWVRIAELEAENKRLKAEHTKLREALEAIVNSFEFTEDGEVLEHCTYFGEMMNRLSIAEQALKVEEQGDE